MFSNLSFLCIVARVAVTLTVSVYLWLCYTGEQKGNQNVRTHFIAEILPGELRPL